MGTTFCLYEFVYSIYFIYVESSVSGLFDLAQCFQSFCILLHGTVIHQLFLAM
jgi:hypothetical protein